MPRWRQVAVSAILVISLCVAQAAGADHAGKFSFENTQYIYVLNLPETRETRTPLVVALHGYGDSVAQFRKIFQLQTGATLHGSAILFPQAQRDQDGQAAWNVGEGSASHNDLGLLLAMITNMQKKHDLDPSRIFLVGYSNGASMVYQLACARPDMFAAIAVVAGNISASDWRGCAPKQGVPLLHIHGRDDDVVLFDAEPSVRTVVSRWAEWNLAVRQVVRPAYSNATLTRYFDDQDRLVSELAELTEIGHDWPIGFEDQYYADDEIWTFFNRVAPWSQTGR